MIGTEKGRKKSKTKDSARNRPKKKPDHIHRAAGRAPRLRGYPKLSKCYSGLYHRDPGFPGHDILLPSWRVTRRARRKTEENDRQSNFEGVRELRFRVPKPLCVPSLIVDEGYVMPKRDSITGELRIAIGYDSMSNTGLVISVSFKPTS